MSEENLARRLTVYLVTDQRPQVPSLLQVIEEALKGGATAVQLRRKQDEGKQLMEIGQAIRALTRHYQALYFVDDRVDIALLTEADGVHLGQSDIGCSDARKLMGSKLIGISVRNLKEARRAWDEGADYLGVGSIYPTHSKDDAKLTGLAALAMIHRQIPTLPLVGIGGIQTANAAKVLKAGAQGVAVISAIMEAADPSRVARSLKELCGALSSPPSG